VTLLVDSDIWIAAQDKQNRDHGACHGPARESEFLRLVASGVVQAIDLTLEDWVRSVELIDTYATLRLGAVDASVVAVAERLKLTDMQR
jgi:uncharacterized protein